jgi:hypothetical protein
VRLTHALSRLSACSLSRLLAFPSNKAGGFCLLVGGATALSHAYKIHIS